MRLKDFVSWNNKKESTFFFSLIIYKHDIHIVHNILIFGKLKKNSKHLKNLTFHHTFYIRSKKYPALSYKGMYTLSSTLRTPFPNLVIGSSTIFPVAKDVTTNFFFTATCGEMRGNNWRNRISTTVHVFLGRKKRENRGKSFSVGCLLVHLVVICYFRRNYPSFLTPDTLVFPRKYSVSVSLTARNDRDKKVKSI